MILSKDIIHYIKQPLLAIMVALLYFIPTSCTSPKQVVSADFRTLAHAGIVLGFDIELYDNHRLYIEAAGWVGVPYSYGGATKQGTDCSGLAYNICKNVYGVHISRSCQKQFEEDCSKYTSQKSLKPGDLVFFSSSGSKKAITHVGIYLKNGRFIHASSSKGVIVDNIMSDYWKKQWIGGGHVSPK